MNNLVTDPVGIDSVIEQLQKPLYKTMNDLAQTQGKEFNGFGRVFKSKVNDLETLEYLKTNGEYEDVLGGEDSRFFFYLHDELNGNTDVSAKVDLIFIVDLNMLFSSNQRRDEELRAIIADNIERSRFNLKKIILGTEHVKRIVSKPFSDTNLKFSDVHPYHVVTFQTEVHYKLKTC